MKDVTDAFRDEVRPLLAARGFGGFTANGAWRAAEGRAEVVYLRGLSSYNAGTQGVTPHSFSVEFGSVCKIRRQ